MKGLAVLLFSFLLALAAAQNASDLEFGPGQDGSLPSNSSSSSSGQSQCQLCADGGDCSEAYKNNPGQYCNKYIDKQGNTRPCCCPTDAVCKPMNYECHCSPNGDHSTYSNALGDVNGLGDDFNDFNTDSEDTREDAGSFFLWWVGILLALLIAAVVGGCISLCRKQQRHHEMQDLYEAPYMVHQVDQYGNPIGGAYGQPSYYPQQRAYVPPGYHGQSSYANNVYKHNYHGGGLGAGAVAAGVGGGLLGGMVLSNALESNNSRGNEENTGEDTGGGDFGGDF